MRRQRGPSFSLCNRRWRRLVPRIAADRVQIVHDLPVLDGQLILHFLIALQIGAAGIVKAEISVLNAEHSQKDFPIAFASLLWPGSMSYRE